jgi:beta-glucosidase
LNFSKDFVWGAAAASYQIEGNTSGVDGCGESTWDMFSRRKDVIKGGNHGLVACDHYHRFKEDVAIMKSMGIKAYRLSIMWPRVIPDGTGQINQKGLDFYNQLIDELLAAGIVPWVTLFHWDYPMPLFHKGGWLNDDSSDWFAEYSRVIVKALSDRVSNWFTLNEQACFIGLGYQVGYHAPGLELPLDQVNRCWHNALLSHGKSVQVIRAESKLNSQVGGAPCFHTAVPETESLEDIEAARRYNFNVKDDTMFNASWWLDPVFKGEYPKDGMERYGASAPVIKEGDMALIQQPLDFVGFNCYHSCMVRADEQGDPIKVDYPNDYPHTMMNWPVTPEALRWGCKFLYERYNLPVVITENGLSLNDWVSLDGQVHDPKRIDFLSRYLLGMKESIDDGVDILGYFQWSIMDNFEWAEGYYQRFGLVHVDYATQKRTIKDSGYWYKGIIESNGEKLGTPSPLSHWRTPSDFNNNISDA